jgi:hypothetical protein
VIIAKAANEGLPHGHMRIMSMTIHHIMALGDSLAALQKHYLTHTSARQGPDRLVPIPVLHLPIVCLEVLPPQSHLANMLRCPGMCEL